MRGLNHLLDADRIDPGAPAVGDGDRSVDYAQLADRAGRLSAALVDAGVGPGDRVGIHLRKSVESMVAVHAVLRAGAVYVPLDRAAPTDYVAGLMRDCGVAVAVSDASPGQLAELSTQTPLGVVVGPDAAGPGPRVVPWTAVAGYEPAPAVEVATDDPAYVIYTSGSTGRPKGIVHTHGSGLAYARLAAATYGLRPDDRMANVAPLHFDQSTFEVLAGPLAGSFVLVIPDPVLRFPASVTELIERERVTIWYSVPYLLLQLLRRGVLDQRDLSSLRWVLFGGEVFPPGLLAELMEQLPHARFSNVYGPAEVNQCTYYHLDEPPPADEPVPVGRAWDDTELVVVDDDDHPVGAGCEGELLVRSTTVMSGYWGQPEATEAAFRTLAGAASDGARWYATGDLVAERPDGDLVFLGRADHQVKVRGHRVELEAVESAMQELDGVSEAAAVVRGTEDIVALVVADGSLDADAVLASLRERLPSYAVPAQIVEVPRLPRTATAKIDRERTRELLVDGS